MTPVRQRMLHELQRRNYSPSTIRAYLGAVQQFAEHFRCSPEKLEPFREQYGGSLTWPQRKVLTRSCAAAPLPSVDTVISA